MTSTQVAVLSEAEVTVGSFIKHLIPEMGRALPNGMDADRMARIALTVVRQSDIQARKDNKPQNSLANCTPQSFAGALLTSSALGLEVGSSGEAYLVPYAGECTLIIGYQGFAKLFWQHPLAKDLQAEAVHEGDEFDYSLGTLRYLKHKPAARDRGKVTHYYATAELTNGAHPFVVLTADEVKALRGGKIGPSGQIKDPMRWMERKTALRQLFKLLPKSATMVAAIAVDEQKGSVLLERAVPSAVAAGESFAQLPASTADEARAQIESQQANRVTVAEITGRKPVTRDEEIAEHEASIAADAAQQQAERNASLFPEDGQ